MFVFAIFISLLTTVIIWYIPATQTGAEQNYQSDTLASMASLSSEISNPSLATGTLINQNMPLGIKGSFILPSTPTSLTYSSSGYSGTLRYGIGLGFTYLNAHPTSAVLNKIVGTYPSQNISGIGAIASAPAFQNNPAFVYAAGFKTSNVAVINANTGKLISYIYAGGEPDALAYDPVDHLLFVADYLSQSNASSTFSSVSVISTANTSYGPVNSYVTTITGLHSNPTTIVYGYGNVYVASSKNSFVTEIGAASFKITATLASLVGTAYHTPVLGFDSTHDQVVAITTKAGTYSVMSADLSTVNSYTVSSAVIGTNAAFSGLAVDGSTYFISFRSSGTYANGGIFAVSTSVLGIATLIGNVITFGAGRTPGNLTYDITSGYLAAIVHSTGSLDYVYAFSNLAGLLTQIGSTTVSKPALSIAFEDSLKYSGSSTSDFMFVTGPSLEEESQIMINSGSVTNHLSLYRTILDNFFQRPDFAVYDPFYNYIYISNYRSGTITVISPITNKLIGSVQLSSAGTPTAMAVDPVSGQLMVVEPGTSSIALINGTAVITQSITVKSSTTTFVPYGIAFDNKTRLAYVTGNTNPKGTGGVFSLNLSTVTTTLVTTFSGSAQSIEFNSFDNQTYFVSYEGGSFYVNNAGSGTTGQNLLYQTNSRGTYTFTFDPYDGYMYAAFSVPSHAGIIEIYSGAFIRVAYFGTGGEPTGPVFDAGNNLVYVPNSAFTGTNFGTTGSNVTIIDATKNAYVSTIWVGDGPKNACFDPNNGYIYVPDNLSEKLTEIDGGFTIFNSKPGVLIQNRVNVGGSIVASGQTSFVSKESYIMEGGSLVQNGSSGNAKVIGQLPVEISENSGKLYLSAVAINLAKSGSSSSSSISSTTSTSLQLQILNKINSLYYVGDQFFISDLYGNQYEAVVTNVFLEFFTMTINTPFANIIDNSLYAKFNGTSTTAPASGSWEFSVNSSPFPFLVSLNGDHLSISLGKSVSVYSASVIYYDVGLNAL